MTAIPPAGRTPRRPRRSGGHSRARARHLGGREPDQRKPDPADAGHVGVRLHRLDHEDTLMSPAGEIAPTHKTINGRAVQIFHVEGETIAAIRLYFDQVQVMTQLGLMPEPATA